MLYSDWSLQMGQMVPKMTLGTRIPAGMDGEGARPKIYWAGRGTTPSPLYGAGQGKGQNLRGGERSGQGTYCVYQLIEIIRYSKGFAFHK